LDKKSHILLVVISLGSAETNVGWGGKLNGYLMASCVRNIYAQSYQNLIIGFQVTVENVGDVFGTQCSFFEWPLLWPSSYVKNKSDCKL